MHLARGLGLALAIAAALDALAHAGERGFILLLPTGLFQVGGATAVAVSFAVVIGLRAAALSRLLEARWVLPVPLPRRVPALNAAATTLLAGLIAAGFAGSRDPLLNPLPLSVWTLLWVGLTFAHALLGHLWPLVSPWTAPAALVRRLVGRPERSRPMAYPLALGSWPAVLVLVLFAWFELVFPAPQDPAVLAWVVLGYSACTVAGMVVFGDDAWNERVEMFSRFFRIVSWLAPIGAVETPGGARRFALTLPGARLLAVRSLPPAGIAFVVVALATVSFDGLSRTFWWLDLLGENPLEHPGRTALVPANTLGLLAAPLVLLGAFVVCAALGARWSHRAAAPTLGRFVVSLVPIAFGYHVAHYLPAFLVDAQHALKALSDPLHRGWNLLGARDLHVTASLLTHHASVERLWYTQVGVIVLAHVAAVVVLHVLVRELVPTRAGAIAHELPLTGLMVAYTWLGLWLLSTPVAG